MNTISQNAVNIANDAVLIEEIIMPKIEKVLNEAQELGNIQMKIGNAIIHALNHNIITLDEADGLMLNLHII